MLQFQEIQTFLMKVQGWKEEIPSAERKAQGMLGQGPVFHPGLCSGARFVSQLRSSAGSGALPLSQGEGVAEGLPEQPRLLSALLHSPAGSRSPFPQRTRQGFSRTDWL